MNEIFLSNERLLVSERHVGHIQEVFCEIAMIEESESEQILGTVTSINHSAHCMSNAKY